MLETCLAVLVQNNVLRTSCLNLQEICCALIEIFLAVIEGIDGCQRDDDCLENAWNGSWCRLNQEISEDFWLYGRLVFKLEGKV